jgi:hypothetical protein
MSEQQFKIGDTVTYKTVDMEYYSRGYGINYETKGSTIVAICYKLANGDTVEQKQLTLVESKSEPPKTKENGSSS